MLPHLVWPVVVSIPWGCKANLSQRYQRGVRGILSLWGGEMTPLPLPFPLGAMAGDTLHPRLPPSPASALSCSPAPGA